MTITTNAKPRLTSLAPQFLVDDLGRTIAYYRDTLGFAFGEPMPSDAARDLLIDRPSRLRALKIASE